MWRANSQRSEVSAEGCHVANIDTCGLYVLCAYAGVPGVLVDAAGAQQERSQVGQGSTCAAADGAGDEQAVWRGGERLGEEVRSGHGQDRVALLGERLSAAE